MKVGKMNINIDKESLFNSIKSRIVIFTASLMIILTLITSIAISIGYKNDKKLMIKGCDFAIFTSVEQINDKISNLGNNAIDLALMGEVYYNNGKSKSIADYYVKNIFKTYHDSLGGGIWFEPYVINPNKKLSSTYAYKNENGQILLDEDFESDKYNYIEKSWYKEIKSQVLKGEKLAWSMPYLESQGSEALMITVGSGIYSNGKLVGLSTVDWEITSIIKTISDIKPTQGSFTLLINKKQDYVISSTDKYNKNSFAIGASLKEVPWYSDDLKNGDVLNYSGIKYISFSKQLDNGMTLIVNVPEKELMIRILRYINVVFVILLLLCLFISVAMYYILEKNVNKPIDELINAAEEFGKGNLDTKISIKSSQEFEKLAQTFNKMTDDIKQYIDNLETVALDKQKIKAELNVARDIQYSAVPKDFYEERKDFDIFASMNSAREVCGDFYDFFFIDKNKLMFLIADVSGKGIPVALSMMTSQTVIRNIAKNNYSSKEMVEQINKQLCIINKQDFFVTSFIGIINISTGEMTFVNAGHKPPLIKRVNGNYEYLQIEPNSVLGAKSDNEYTVQETVFEKGDEIFLYTDGITNAVNENNEFYGETRLLDCLNNNNDENLKDFLDSVKKDINKYVSSVEQTDDMTMLMFRYNGLAPLSFDKFEITAQMENYNQFSTWLNNICEKFGIPQVTAISMKSSAKEIYTNIAKYAYDGGNGKIKVSVEKFEKEVVMQFEDNGKAYNPLENEIPNQSGDSGFSLVKRLAHDISYKNKNDKNILTVKFI